MAKFIVVHSVKVATEFVPETFGRLTTIGPKFQLGRKDNTRKDAYQVCICDCGSVGVFICGDIKRTNTRSCGCFRRERIKQISTTHGMTYSPEYRTYTSMRVRCSNPNDPFYPDYGGRGIRVCARWLDQENGFVNFLADMGPRPANHTIERKQVNGNYCPENCCWATTTEQSRNRRSNVNITFDGKTQCIAAWVEKALTTPARTCNAKKNP